MRWFQLYPKLIADRVLAAGEKSLQPALGRSILHGTIGFTIVSVAGFAPWALAGRALQHAIGEIGLYAVCAVVFMSLSGVFLHRLIIGAGSLLRFYALFTMAFGAYSVCWTVGWMLLRGNLGSIVGLALGTCVMAWILVRAFDAPEVFFRVATALFVLNVAGYFAGGWAEQEMARVHIDHLLGMTVDRNTRRSIAMLMWGVCYGIGLGAGLGLAFYWYQSKARALLTSR